MIRLKKVGLKLVMSSAGGELAPSVGKVGVNPSSSCDGVNTSSDLGFAACGVATWDVVVLTVATFAARVLLLRYCVQIGCFPW